jgi:hypothetical protein
LRGTFLENTWSASNAPIKSFDPKLFSVFKFLAITFLGAYCQLDKWLFIFWALEALYYFATCGRKALKTKGEP